MSDFIMEREAAPCFSAKKIQESDYMDKWICTICGYVYDPAVGDPNNGVAAGTSWDDVPDDWECPICGAPKEDFAKE